MDRQKFYSKKISKTATIVLKDNIENVFPLFGAFEERKWASGWNPKLIYPNHEIIEEGTTFKTSENNSEEKEFLWIVIKFEPDNYLLQYLVTTMNRYWTITIKCIPLSKDETSCDITYKYIGLNEKGNEINKESLQKIFKNNLKDWEEEINYYLKNK